MFFKNFYSELKKQLIDRPDIPMIATEQIGWSHQIRIGRGIAGQALKIGSRTFSEGWGDHANSRHVVHVPGEAVSFEAFVGVMHDPQARVTFFVEDMAGNVLGSLGVFGMGDEARLLSAALPGLRDFVIRAYDADSESKGWTGANVLWGDPAVVLKDGRRIGGNSFGNREKSPVASFLCDGVEFRAGSITSDLIEETADYRKYCLEKTSQDGTLTVRETVKIYRDFPVIEWLPELLNRSDRPSGIVSGFKSLDLSLDLIDRSTGYLRTKDGFTCAYPIHDVALRRTLGSKNCQSDFTEETVMLYPRYPKDHVRMDTDEGRSSAAWLPYFGLDETEDQGLNIAVGWSGEWYADFKMLSHQLKVEAGMRETHFRVLPGETLRQVSIILHHRDGLSVEDGQNQFRRFMLKHHSPRRADGTVRQVPYSFSVWGGALTQSHLDDLAMIRKCGFEYDVFWGDAGWFGGNRPVAATEFDGSDWYSTVGNWTINGWAHPDGFRPVADAAHKAGLKFMLWYEMERVMKGTPVAQAHPEWMLDTNPPSGHYLLNFGCQEAVDWAVEQVAFMVREHGLDYYRQDFNFNTIPFWRANDAPDRVGVSEMKHIAGLYKFWDTLLAMFPDMMIDNCASGGRRIDFETNSRSICLYRSDMLGRPWYDSSEASQIETAYLSRWVPLHGGGTTYVNHDDYGFLSGAVPGASVPIADSSDLDVEWVRGILAVSKRMRALCPGDMYLLAEAPESHRNIYAYQCDVPEEGKGFFIAFRRPAGGESVRKVSLRKIDPSAEYEVEIYNGGTKRMRGADLREYVLNMPEPRSVHLVFYTKLG